MLKITICGGGSLGHVCLGVLSSQKGVSVSLLSNHIEKWRDTILVKDINGKEFVGKLDGISSDPKDVIPNADIILFCLPGFLIEETLLKIKPFLTDDAVVGSIVCSTGFFFFAHQILENRRPLFGFQRVPFIARIVEYGKFANLLGYKESLSIAEENISGKESFRKKIENLFSTPVKLLNSFYEVSLTNSNPILHTGRLYSMWHDWSGIPYERCILFYKEWTDDAAQKLIDMDAEFMSLLDKLPMDKGAIPSLLEYYQSHDAQSLATKLRSIQAFQTILAPMKETDKGWIPDFSSRYFTEDFPFGLKFIVDLARKYEVKTPRIDEVFNWGMEKCNG